MAGLRVNMIPGASGAFSAKDPPAGDPVMAYNGPPEQAYHGGLPLPERAGAKPAGDVLEDFLFGDR